MGCQGWKCLSKATDENIQNWKNIYFDKSLSFDDRIKKLGIIWKIQERSVRKVIAHLGWTEPLEPKSEDLMKAKKRKVNRDKNVFFITWAQNSTKVHKGFWDNMLRYAEYLDADIHVMAGKYRVDPESGYIWDKRVKPYLDANTHDIHKHLTVESSVNILATAVNPFSGMSGFSGSKSCVFGHPKVQLETLPILNGERQKIMMTTGACTVPNYTHSKAGAKGKFNHILGFVVIEIKDKNTFFMRQVTADKDGSFTDLVNKVDSLGIFKINECEGLVLGDLHCGQHEKKLVRSTLGLIDIIKPKNIVLHDVFDGYSINHHDYKNPIKQYQKEIFGKNSLSSEVKIMLETIKPFSEIEGCQVVVVRSNHDEFVDRWIINEDWKKSNPKNYKEYMQYALILLEEQHTGYPKGLIPTIINQRYPNFITLDRNKGYKIAGFECGYHGDIGNNGVRGSMSSFRNLNTKSITAHLHSPQRKDGALIVGTSSVLRMEYNKGGSSWCHAHVMIHKDGKAQHIIFDPKTYEFTTLINK